MIGLSAGRSWNPKSGSKPRYSAGEASPFLRRAAATLVAGIGLISLGFWSLDPSIAAEGARGGGGYSPIGFILSQAARSEARVVPERVVSVEPRARSREKSAPKLASASAVCVRLCDGFFFPATGGDGQLASRQASCNSLCPGAATRVFVEPSGADGIDGATSLNGARYSALPTAFHYRATIDNACTCRGAAPVNETLAGLTDASLRRGDVVMTANGMRVFRGGHAPRGAQDFVGLAQASIPRRDRETLLAMERATLRHVYSASTLAAVAGPTHASSAGISKLPLPRRDRTAALP